MAAGYVQNEQPYVYCNTCGRKDYRLSLATLLCNAYNSAPAKYPDAPCQGIMTLTTETLSQLDNQTYIPDHATS